MSMRSASPGMPLPLTSNAFTAMADCDAPSLLMLSGVAVTRSDWANSDGPESGGVVCWLVVHAALSRSVAAVNVRNSFPMVMSVGIPEVAEIDLHGAHRTHVV